MREGKLSLRNVLGNFINHVDALEAKRREGNDLYEAEFQELKQLTESLKARTEFSSAEGEKDVNRRKNRYKDILPYDLSRVVLSSFPGVPGSDYINANFIRGASGSRAYIGSQGPLPHTVPHFWRMVVECEVQVIIMASNETEGGKHKCECYWVDSQHEERQFGSVSVSLVKARQVCPDFLVRTLRIKYSATGDKTEERTICQFHYVLWPDHGVPETVRPLLDMVRLVRDCQASETLPLLVHCSAGCGRTGTICAIDYVWGLLRAGRLTDNLDLFGLVKEMRQQRVAMVQTREQYILLHRAVRELFKERLKVIDAHPYENVATDGTPLTLREKDTDYEELYIHSEKQDESAKAPPLPTCAPPQGTSVPCTASELPQPAPPAAPPDPPPLSPPQAKAPKTQHTPHFPLPQISPLTPASPLPMAWPVPASSPQQAKLSFVGSPSCLGPSLLAVPPGVDSALAAKLEKEAENVTHRQQQMGHGPASSPHQQGSSPPEAAGPFIASHTPALVSPPLLAKHCTSLPRTTTTTTCTSLPRTTTTTTASNRSCQGSDTGERPSIAKLKELFERRCPADRAPPARLSRSASSVTARSALSLQAVAHVVGYKIKRKSSLGAEETVATKKAYKSIEKHRLQDGQREAGLVPACPSSAPVHPASATHRRDTPLHEGEASTRALLARLDERPALPIKKSKSFRYVRPAHSSAAAAPCSPELARKKADINAYFSLDRCRPDTARAGRPDTAFLGDVPSPRDGFKLSVYQTPHLTQGARDTMPQGARDTMPQGSWDTMPQGSRDTMPQGSRDTMPQGSRDTMPQIPPKRVIGEKFRVNKAGQLACSSSLPCFPQPLPPTSLSPNASTLPLAASTTLPQAGTASAPASQPTCGAATTTTTTTTKPPPLSPIYNSPRDLSREWRCHQGCSLHTQGQARGLESGPEHCSPDSASPAKDYVNARLVVRRYVPRPAKRATRPTRDYVNCSLTSAAREEGGWAEVGQVCPEYDEVLSPGQAQCEATTRALPEPAAAAASEWAPHASEWAPHAALAASEWAPHASEWAPPAALADYAVMECSGSGEAVNETLVAGRRGQQGLDCVAQQVFEVCQDYLHQGQGGASVEEVASRVAVAPQGLRTRERRNSYRQAVNHLADRLPRPEPPGSTHKYETLWFDRSPAAQTVAGQSVAAQSVAGQSGVGGQKPEPLQSAAGEDFWANLDLCSSNKEMLFREKLEQLHSLMTGLGQPPGGSPGSGTPSVSSHGPGGPPEVACASSASQTPPSFVQATDLEAEAVPGSNQPGLASYGTTTTAGGPWGKPLPPYTCPLPPCHNRESEGVPRSPDRARAAWGRHRCPQPPPPPPRAGEEAGEECMGVQRGVALRGGGPVAPVAPPRVKRGTLVEQRPSPDPHLIHHWRLCGPRHPTPPPADQAREDGPPSIPAKPPAYDCHPAAAPCSTSHPAAAPCSTSHPAAAPCSTSHPAAAPCSTSHPAAAPCHYTHLPPPKPLPPPHAAQRSVPTSPRKMADCSWEAGGRQAAGCSSDSSDDEGMFHKLSAPSIFRKWRRQVAPVSPKSTFYECWEEGVEAPPCALPSPTSPKPLARALGKLKLNSRSVASNFKSYLSHRSGQAETDGEAGGRTNGFPASPPPSWRPLQKSVSSGAALTAFTQVAQDYKYPYAIPKKPSGPRDMAAALRGGTGTLNIKMDQPRQQYL